MKENTESFFSKALAWNEELGWRMGNSLAKAGGYLQHTCSADVTRPPEIISVSASWRLKSKAPESWQTAGNRNIFHSVGMDYGASRGRLLRAQHRARCAGWRKAW